MGAAAWPALAGGLGGGVDPWVERDRFTAGSPVQITGLARAFASAAGRAQLATELGQQGSRLTGAGFRNDGLPVHEVEQEVARTRRQVGNGGETLARIATVLDGIADDLSTRTTTANGDITDLESQLAVLKRNFDAYEVRYQAAMAQVALPIDIIVLIQQHGTEEKKYQDASLSLVRQFGAKIGGSVADYDAALGKRVRDLADLGYYPPDDLAEGPGDATGDPNAGRDDARKVKDALHHAAGKQTLAEIDAATAQISALNAKVANGGHLTDAERAYLTQFYDTLGTDDLAALPAALRNAAPAGADPRRGPDGQPLVSTQEAYNGAMAPFRDSLMNLSAGVSYESLPAAVRSLVDDTHLGVIDPDTGLRWPSQSFLDGRTVDAKFAGGVTGQDRYDALAELTTSTVAPGTGLATHLADAGIRGKQELNAMQDHARWNLSIGTMGGGTDATVHRLDAMIDDTSASTLLSAAARNHDASSAILLDGHRRAAVMGLNWEDGQGATDLVASGTERDPTAGGGHKAQAEAALAVVQEVAHDRDGYLHRMNDQVKGAVTDVGLQYFDSFEREPGTTSGYATDLTDPLGRPVGPSFQLGAADRDHYLQFVSGTGDDNAAAFHAKALAASQAQLGDAFAHGDAKAVTEALQNAGRLDGAITQADYDYTLDGVADADAQRAAAYRAEQMHHKAIQIATTIGTSIVGGGIAIGTAGVGSPLIGPTVALGSAIVNSSVGVATIDDPAPKAQLPQTRDDLYRVDAYDAPLQRDTFIAGAMRQAGLVPDSGVTSLPYDDVRVSSQARTDLNPALVDALNGWEARHATPGNTADVDLGSYDIARSSTRTPTYDGAGAPARSAWTGDDNARALVYGPDYRGHEFTNPPVDPRKLDDPGYDRVRDR